MTGVYGYIAFGAGASHEEDEAERDLRTHNAVNSSKGLWFQPLSNKM
jgi:hypothetical protein